MANELVREYGADGWQTGPSDGGSQPDLPLDLGPGIYQISETGIVTQLPTDWTVDELNTVVVDLAYVDESNYGIIWGARIAGEPVGPQGSYIFRVALDKMNFTSAPGEGEAALTINSSDENGSLTLGSAGVNYHNGVMTIFAFNNDSFGLFDKGGNPSQQRELARPSGDAGDLWDILEAYGLVKAP